MRPLQGSSHGIGAATAKLLGERGANVVVNYYSSQEAAEKVVEYIENNGGHAIAIKADARNKEDIDNLVQKTKETFGSIDIFVHNAGMKFPMKSFEDMQWDEFIHKTDDGICCNALISKLICNIFYKGIQTAFRHPVR